MGSGRGQHIEATRRRQIRDGIEQAQQAGARKARACALLSLSSRTLQRWQKAEDLRDKRTEVKHVPSNKLSDAERQRILAIANSPTYAALAPSQIVPRLADQGEYVASESSFYRVLKAAGQLKHRRASRPPQNKPKAHRATAPNQLYSWDITYLMSQIKGMYFYLYLVMDVFSRKIVGWQVYAEQSSALAADLMRDVCECERIQPHQVVLHSDNGSPMKGANLLSTLQDLGVALSFSRPSVSNDNPYSEALFKTLKYRPEYPRQPFDDIDAARHWVTGFVQWYNHEHRHAGIKFVTPAQRHDGKDSAILRHRQSVYSHAKAKHPERWSGHTRNWQRIDEVTLNPETTQKAA